MKFYRPLNTIAALTFDLDDTLYDNRPVIIRSEYESLCFIQRYHPRLSHVQTEDLLRQRLELRKAEPDISHDVTQWRYRAVEQLMIDAGINARQAQKGAQDVMAHFALWRSKIHVPQETHDTLSALSKKWPLVAITNGNAQPHLFGLDTYFHFILRAGPDGRAKPYCDLYHLAAQKLSLPAEHILHVGDDVTTDVAGAIRSGLQACWINLRNDDLIQMNNTRLLPHLEISQLASLTALI